MAKARAIDNRRKAVANIKKITRTMQLIATARFQQSLQRAVRTKPYTQKITEMVQQVSAAGGTVEHPLLRSNPNAPRRAILLLTSNRGLCGGYNGGVIRKAMAVSGGATQADDVDLYIVGKKGANYFKFLQRPIHKTYPNLGDSPMFDKVEPIAVEFMDRYAAGEYSSVQIVYTKFLSVARQAPDVLQLLPIQADAVTTGSPVAKAKEVQYEFSPDPATLLAELLPATVKIRLFQCFNDAVVSENVARMVAMKSATDAASEMVKLLGQQYNRARQSQITMELLDIMGGVEALK